MSVNITEGPAYVPSGASSNLNRARKAKNDEFYTQLVDIEREAQHYDFRGKSVFVNCDDPDRSNFWKYFSDNFDKLGLAKLVSCHLSEDNAYSLEKASGDPKEWATVLEGNGSFDSDESLDLLEQCDVVVTNPPFSLFRPFMETLISSGKEFLVLGSVNATAYKDIFPHIRDGELWLGVNTGKLEFEVPGELADPNKQSSRVTEDGKHLQFFNNIRWFTNMGTNSHRPGVELTKTYYGNEHEYPRYTNYDAINVDRFNNYPADYDGVVGVPITFLDKWNPAQFEIVDMIETPKIGDRNVFKRFAVRRVADLYPEATL